MQLLKKRGKGKDHTINFQLISSVAFIMEDFLPSFKCISPLQKAENRNRDLFTSNCKYSLDFHFTAKEFLLLPKLMSFILLPPPIEWQWVTFDMMHRRYSWFDWFWTALLWVWIYIGQFINTLKQGLWQWTRGMWLLPIDLYNWNRILFEYPCSTD